MENLKMGTWLIKPDTKDYSLTKERAEKINSLDIKEEHKGFFKNLFGGEPTPTSPELLVEIIGETPFLTINSIKNNDTGEIITERFINEKNSASDFWVLTKHLVWVNISVM
jgi:hypothetical protein